MRNYPESWENSLGSLARSVRKQACLQLFCKGMVVAL